MNASVPQTIDTNSEINKLSFALASEIAELDRQLKEKRSLLTSVQKICTHPRIEKYRDYRTGICEFCMEVFPTKDKIDLIFSD